MSRASVFIPESYNNAERYYKTKNNIYASYDDWRHDNFYHMALVIDKKYEKREDGSYGLDCKFPVYHEKNADFFWMYIGDSFMDENLNSDRDFRVSLWTTNEKECISFRDYMINNDKWETDGTCYSYSETVFKKENKIEKKLIICEIVNDDQGKYLDFYKTMDVCIGFFDSHSSKYSRSISISGPSTAAAIRRISPLLELNNDDAWEAIMEELKNYKSQEIDVRTTVEICE